MPRQRPVRDIRIARVYDMLNPGSIRGKKRLKDLRLAKFQAYLSAFVFLSGFVLFVWLRVADQTDVQREV